MQTNTSDLERPMLRMGSVAFIAGIVIAIVSTYIHSDSEDLMDNPVVFAVYAEDDLWIASHIGQFVGGMLIFAGGFVALHRLLVKSESGTTASALAWFGLVAAILVASTFTILQAVDGIALKIAVDTWYAIPPTTTESEEEKAMYFRVAEGLRWTEWGIQAYYRMLQGAVALIFGVAILKSALLARWIGAVGIAAGVVTIAAGIIVAYVGFSSVRDPVVNASNFTLYPWVVILGIFMWRKTIAKKMISR
ncbi:MAG TPA: DUF4386 family protein [Nitrososphaeraceae archaeon]|nr:DUF4386 family protein [Nitrososphaeraceae archaeon]